MQVFSEVRFHKMVFLKEIDSTNDFATYKLSNNDPNTNICVYTFNQTKGRGQIGRFWYSGYDNNLSTSFKWQSVNVKVKDQFLLNMAFALAIYDFLFPYIPDPTQLRIKWPNDIYVGDKKIAGLLIQNTLRASIVTSCILGVGININEQTFPKDLPNPISLSKLTHKTYDLIALQQQLTAAVSTRLSGLSLKAEAVRKAYTALLYRLDKAHLYSIDGSTHTATLLGITHEGKLILSIDGSEKQFNFRELRFVHKGL